jgi:hypothetical protein
MIAMRIGSTSRVKVLSRCAILASLGLLTACGYSIHESIAQVSAPTGTNNSVVATPSTASTINAVVGSSTATTVTFTTNDGATATSLAITAGLFTLPAGWSGPASFTCASVSTGSGCMLNLSYLPTAAGSGTVTLDYSYANNAGTAKTGTITLSYAATSNDNVVATQSPAGQIAAITGSTNAVGVTFTTDDGAKATALSITAGLASLPAGWSGPTTFTCASVSTGNGCLLNLTYHPTSAASGTLQLSYSYNSNSGSAKTGSILIPYTATTNNNLVVTQSPSGSISAVVNSGSVPVTLTFTTDDGNPATAITITSGLGTLPSGWSGPVSFSCASASTGTGCQLPLTYAPTVNGSGTIALGYSYTDDAGTAKTGTANIAYASIAGFLYLTDTVSSVVSCAVSGADGSLSSCASVAGGLSAPTGLAFSGNFAYVTPGIAAADVDVCPVNANGTLGTCTSAQTFGAPDALAVSGGYLYVADAGGPNVYSCTIDADGSLSACIANYIGIVNTVDGIAVTATDAYIVDINGGNLTTCTISSIDGSFNVCTQATLNGTTPAGGNTPNSSPRSATVYGGNLYAGTKAGILVLPIAADGTVTVNYPCSLTVGTSCTDNTAATQTPVTGLAFDNGYAYVSGYGGGGGEGICQLEPSGLIDDCVTSPSLSGYYGQTAFH